jgi:hypothetical protein
MYKIINITCLRKNANFQHCSTATITVFAPAGETCKLFHLISLLRIHDASLNYIYICVLTAKAQFILISTASKVVSLIMNTSNNQHIKKLV